MALSAKSALHIDAQMNSLSRALLDSSLDAVIVSSEDGTIVECNQSAETLFGWDRADPRQRLPMPWQWQESLGNAV